MIFHDVKQNTPEWFKLRAGRITMSELHKIMASAREYMVVTISSKEFGVLDVASKKVYKKTYKTKEDAEKFAADQKKKADDKGFSKLAEQYAVTLAIEQITGEPVPSALSNPHLDRGHEQEPAARFLYEIETFQIVKEGGFFCNDVVGYSPDGLIEGQKGSIEILSCISSVHFENVKRLSIYPPKKWQCIGALKYAELDWIDFVSYCADFPAGKRLFRFRMVKEDYLEEFKMIDKRIEQFLTLVSETKENILKSEYFI